MVTPALTFKRAAAFRRALTPPEARLWTQLKGGKLGGHRFRRQHPVGPYILDFYCAAAKLAVEVDGVSHEIGDRPDHDARRTAWLDARGIEVLRIQATDVRDDLDSVLASVEAAASRRAPPSRR